MILKEIKKTKFLTLDKFTDYCLYKFKNSYYQKKKILAATVTLLLRLTSLVFFLKCSVFG